MSAAQAATILRSLVESHMVYRSSGRMGKWACTVRGATTYHFRKAEAVAHAMRVLGAAYARSEVQS